MNKLIDVKELIAKLTPEEIKTSAEEYFSSIKDPSYHLAKPFARIDECPALITHFAKIVQGAALLPGQRVLEFGAGSCWAGRLLNQLGLEVVSLDLSPSALAIGKRLKEAQPVFGPQPEHIFSVFDGVRIDLPDESVDRIICLDCFHHVANPEQVLREFFRILKPNGLVAFSEPGRFHSRSPLSQEEMKNYGVIENDIVVEDIWSWSKAIGFRDIFFSLAFVEPVTLDLKSYLRLQNSGLERETVNTLKTRVEDFHRNVTLFFLTKGILEDGDSRSKPGLVAELRQRGLKNIAGTDNDKIEISLEITNRSNKKWLKSGPGIGNVNLGVHLFGKDGKLLNLDYHRHLFLNDDFLPGQSRVVQFSLPRPSGLKEFVLEFDLVSEQVCWFANNGSQTVRIAV